MISVKLSKRGTNIVVTFNGSQFTQIKEVLKENAFTYKLKYEGMSNVWTQKPSYSGAAIEELLTIEYFPISDEVRESFTIKEETQHYRTKYTTELLVSEPLKEFQKTAIKAGITQSRYYFGLEMGMGKTYIIVNVLNHLFFYKMAECALILAPLESIYNFRDEILMFNSVGITYDDIYIADVNNREPFLSGKKIVIMTYRSFVMLADDGYKEATGVRFKKSKRKSCYDMPTINMDSWFSKRVLISDEAHLLKNIHAKQTQIVELHKQYFNFRYMLSGTPDPLGPEDWYSQLHILDESIIPQAYYTWLGTIAVVGTNFSRFGIVRYKPKKVAEFSTLITPWVMREFGQLDLPPLLIEPVKLILSKKQLAIYRELVVYTLNILKLEDGKIIPKKVESKFPFIIQAVENPCILKGKIDQDASPSLYKLVEAWKFEDHSKLEYLDSLLEKYIAEGHRVIIWSGHPKTIQSLGAYYNKYDPVVLHGEMELLKGESKAEFRFRIVNEFKNNESHKIAILSYQMASTAMNIVQASRTIYFDRSFNSLYWTQSIKRNHRPGQTKTVLVNPLITLGTLEDSLDKRLRNKGVRSKIFFDAESYPMETWTKLFNGELEI